MKSGHFVEGLTNVTRFLELTRAIEARGAREAGIGVVTAKPGYGKTGTLTWYSARKGMVMVRAKAGWTAHWALSDIADAIGVSQQRSTEKLFNAILPEMMARAANDGTVLIVDEADHAARDMRVLETLRDLADCAEAPMIISGMDDIQRQLRRFPQVQSRIADVCTFGPATVDDVRLFCAELTPVQIAPCLSEAVCERTGGRLRTVKNAIARIEYAMKSTRGEITLQRWREAGDRPLTNEDRRATSRMRNADGGRATNALEHRLRDRIIAELRRKSPMVVPEIVAAISGHPAGTDENIAHGAAIMEELARLKARGIVDYGPDGARLREAPHG